MLWNSQKSVEILIWLHYYCSSCREILLDIFTHFEWYHPVYRCHDDVIKWKHFPRYWPFVRRIHQSPVNSPHKGQRRRALIFSLIGVWINGWVNNREAGDLRRYRAHYDVTVMDLGSLITRQICKKTYVGSAAPDDFVLNTLWITLQCEHHYE